MVWLWGQARLQTPSVRLSVHWLLTRNWCWQWCNYYCLSSQAVGRLHPHQCNQMSHHTPFPNVHWWRSPVDQMSRWSLKSTLLKASDHHFSELLIKQPYYYWLHNYILLHTWSRNGGGSPGNNMGHEYQGCTYTTICLYCRYTIILAIRSAVPIPIPIFMAGCINLHDIIVLSNNYCIPYLGKPVHVQACAKLDLLKLGFLWRGKPF